MPSLGEELGLWARGAELTATPMPKNNIPYNLPVLCKERIARIIIYSKVEIYYSFINEDLQFTAFIILIKYILFTGCL